MSSTWEEPLPHPWWVLKEAAGGVVNRIEVHVIAAPHARVALDTTPTLT